MISLAHRAAPQPGLRDQLRAALRYYIVSEPMGFALVAARDASEARDTYFETVKDDLWGDPEHPESMRPYTAGSIRVRLADAEDLARLRSIVPHKTPTRATVLSAEVKARLDASAHPRSRATLRRVLSFVP